MEYFPLGTLDRFINESLRERDVQDISFQLLEGLKVMHEEGFTHRDLKPQNIFVVQTSSPGWWVKIGDFGITKRVANNDTALQTTTGTPHYLAPEVNHYVDVGEADSYTNAVDIWSFACVVYQMLALQTPFPVFPRNLVTFCKGGLFPESPLFNVSKDGIEFVKSVLVPLPTFRPSAQVALESKWLQMEESNPVNIASQHKPTFTNDPMIERISKPLDESAAKNELSVSRVDQQPPTNISISTFDPNTWISGNNSTDSIIIEQQPRAADTPSLSSGSIATPSIEGRPSKQPPIASNSKPSQPWENEKQFESPYGYRGVPVEPEEELPKPRLRRTPPSTRLPKELTRPHFKSRGQSPKPKLTHTKPSEREQKELDIVKGPIENIAMVGTLSDVVRRRGEPKSHVAATPTKPNGKPRRRSKQYETGRVKTLSPPSNEYDDEYDGELPKGSKSSARYSRILSSTDDGDSRSVVSASNSRYDDEPPETKEISRSSRRDKDKELTRRDKGKELTRKIRIKN